MPTELTELEIPRVDLVNIPANRRKFALFKAEGGDMAATDETQNAKDGEVNMAENTKVEQPVAKDEDEITKALGVLKKATLTPAVLKALEDLLEANKPKVEPPKPVEKSAEQVVIEKENAELKVRLVALEKANRMKDLEPVCKAMGLEAEKVFKAERADKEMADYFMAAIATARKQNEELMKELGTNTETVGKGEDAFMAEVDKVAKAEKVDVVKAAEKVAKEQPELWNQHLEARRAAGR